MATQDKNPIRHQMPPQKNSGPPLSGNSVSLSAVALPQKKISRKLTSAATRIALVCLGTSLLSVLIGTGIWLRDLGLFNVNNAALDLIAKHQALDNTLVFDRHGAKIGEFFHNYHVYVPYQGLPQNLINAIIAIEDRLFWQHHGFDPKGITRAIVAHLRRKGPKQGASTLTQQVVRHFLLPADRTPERKIQEIALAIQLERRLTKQKIFEIYANSLFLGNGAYGVGAAAWRYFGKPVAQLTTSEAALIAGLFQSPSRYNPTRHPKRAKARQILVLKAMHQNKMLTLAQTKKLINAPLVYQTYRPLNNQIAPFFLDHIREQVPKLLGSQTIASQGLRIYTTLDRQLQKFAEVSLEESRDLLGSAQKHAANLWVNRRQHPQNQPASVEAAVLAIDPRSGEILTMVGGRNYNKSEFNRAVHALRSPGSAFKPIIYSLALAKRWKWSDIIFVSPINVNNYRPFTPAADMLSETTLLRAFYRSMNTPTVELGQNLGLEPVLAQARSLGIRSPLKAEFGSLLGSSEVTMLDLARVYSTFANRGELIEPISISRIENRDGKILYQAPTTKDRSHSALTPQIAYLMTQGMRSVLASGTGLASARLATLAAGKTGTANDATDNWFCGYTPNLTTIVWVGTDEHKAIYGNFSGSKLALPIWDRFMSKALSVRQAEPFRTPPGIVQALVHPQYGHRSPHGVRMYFLRGQEPPNEPSVFEALSTLNGGYRHIFGH